MDSRIESKIDKLDERLDRIDVTLAAQHVSLSEHIRRTQILESQVEPIKKHVHMAQGVLKAISLLALGAGLAQAILSLIKH